MVPFAAYALDAKPNRTYISLMDLAIHTYAEKMPRRLSRGRNKLVLILSVGECPMWAYYRTPVFFLLLTGDAQENYALPAACRPAGIALVQRLCHAKSEAPWRRRSANFADRSDPIAYSYAQ